MVYDDGTTELEAGFCDTVANATATSDYKYAVVAEFV